MPCKQLKLFQKFGIQSVRNSKANAERALTVLGGGAI
jgi:hypothetical protein